MNISAICQQGIRSIFLSNWNKEKCAFDYTITITVPASEEYVHVLLRSEVAFFGKFYVTASMKADTITLDYNGLEFTGFLATHPKVATKNFINAWTYAGDYEYADGKNMDEFWRERKVRAERDVSW